MKTNVYIGADTFPIISFKMVIVNDWQKRFSDNIICKVKYYQRDKAGQVFRGRPPKTERFVLISINMIGDTRTIILKRIKK